MCYGTIRSLCKNNWSQSMKVAILEMAAKSNQLQSMEKSARGQMTSLKLDAIVFCYVLFFSGKH